MVKKICDVGNVKLETEWPGILHKFFASYVHRDQRMRNKKYQINKATKPTRKQITTCSDRVLLY
jgi:hypothetical protein